VVPDVAPATAALTPSAAPQTSPAPEASSGRGRRIAGAVVAGLGVVGIGIGSVAGIIAISKHDAASSSPTCPKPKPDPCHDPAAAKDWSAATSAGRVSTVAFIAGGAALAVGAVIWFTAPSPAKPSARARATPIAQGGLVSMEGSW
jgi:hypothetical protein